MLCPEGKPLTLIYFNVWPPLSQNVKLSLQTQKNLPLWTISRSLNSWFIIGSISFHSPGLPTCFSYCFQPTFCRLLLGKTLRSISYLSTHPNFLKSYFCEHFSLNYDRLMYHWQWLLIQYNACPLGFFFFIEKPGKADKVGHVEPVCKWRSLE